MMTKPDFVIFDAIIDDDNAAPAGWRRPILRSSVRERPVQHRRFVRHGCHACRAAGRRAGPD
jgi:hypothetical protein